MNIPKSIPKEKRLLLEQRVVPLTGVHYEPKFQIGNLR
jgi:hypothetical protein